MICAIHVLEHFRDPSAALVQFHDWLRPGGYLVLSVSNVEVYHRSPQGRFHFAHLYNFNRDSLILLARKAGFDIFDDTVGKETEIVFVKRERDESLELAAEDNYRRLRHYFDTHTVFNYYTSSRPYLRFLHKMTRKLDEYRVISAEDGTDSDRARR